MARHERPARGRYEQTMRAVDLSSALGLQETALKRIAASCSCEISGICFRRPATSRPVL
jgi:hypothetical protein